MLFVSLEDIQKIGCDNAILVAYIRDYVHGQANYYKQFLIMNDTKLLKEFYSEATEDDLAQMEEFRRGGDWTVLTHEQVKDDIGMTTTRQVKYFKELVKHGYIETKRKGVPGRRWVRLCNDR